MSEKTHDSGEAQVAFRESRRKFLLLSGVAAGQVAAMLAPCSAPSAQADGPHAQPPAQGENPAPAFNFNGVTMPRRKSFFDYTATDVQLLTTAYGAIKNLPMNDPRSWINQANIHASHCGGDLLDVHGGWWFTVWHRCYLFFYERILAQQSGNPGAFALPYWDWANHQSIPNAQFLEQQNQPSPFFDPTSPLNDKLRNPTADSTFSSDPNMSQAARYCDPDYISNQLLKETDFNTFCGYPDQGGPGDLEQFPHNNVHIWVGDNTGHEGQDMDDLTVAAKDILFFLHHANVDRLFTIWLANNSGSLPPLSSKWYTQFFNFYDENGKLVSVTVNDALTHMTGNYQPPQQHFQLVSRPQEFTLGGPTKTIENIALPDQLRRTLALSATTAAPPSVRLKFQAVEAPHDVPVILHVFINKKDATFKDVGGPNYAGTLTLLPSSKSRGKKHSPIDLSLAIGAKFGNLLQKSHNVSVTIVSEKGFKKPAEHAPTVKFQKLSVVTTP